MIAESDIGELPNIHILLLSEERPPPGQQELLFWMVTDQRKCMKGGKQFEGIKSAELVKGQEVLAKFHRSLPWFREKDFPLDFTNEFRGAVLLFDLSKKDAIPVYRKQLFDVQKHFDDDFRLVVISYLKPGDRQKIRTIDYLHFLKEHGWPTDYEWKGKYNDQIMKGINDLMMEVREIQI